MVSQTHAIPMFAIYGIVTPVASVSMPLCLLEGLPLLTVLDEHLSIGQLILLCRSRSQLAFVHIHHVAMVSHAPDVTLRNRITDEC